MDRPPPGHHWGGPLRWPAVGLTVRDDGAGVAPENLARLCEPFYTTKPGGSGAGLGLYNARVFVERHHGMMAVASAPQAGSAFSLVFPEADFEETPIAAAAGESKETSP